MKRKPGQRWQFKSDTPADRLQEWALRVLAKNEMSCGRLPARAEVDRAWDVVEVLDDLSRHA
jgi:hypothetical protein